MKLATLFETMEEILQARLPKIKRLLKKKYGNPIGEGRNRLVYGSKKVVIKIPKNEYGVSDNYYEKRVFDIDKSEKRYAKCKLIHILDIPILYMEKLNIDYHPSQKPEWSSYIDTGQVGTDKKGQWKAFDYGRN